jgi:hypothetical protein
MTTPSVIRLIAALVTLLIAAPAFAAPQSPAINLAPHRAIYDMTLRDATAGSNISDIRGRLVFDFEGASCDGYSLRSRLVTETVDRDGNSTLTDLRSSTWENFSGDKFRFENSQYVGRELSEQSSGNATRRKKQEGIDVNLKKPSSRQLQFAGAALFPTQHSIAILQAALQGETVLQADIYDGSEQGNKLFRTTTFIGKPASTLADQIPSAGVGVEKVRLNGMTSWPVAISYFDAVDRPDQDEGVPTYELSFHLLANGVSRDLLINYGNFLVRGELKRVDFYDQAKCPEKKKQNPR